jgi:transposase InsO family protein
MSPDVRKLQSPPDAFFNSDEGFRGILKNELVHHRRYATRQEAQKEITEYIEMFYNRQRRQARLGYLSPAAFQKNFVKEQCTDQRFGVRY